MIFSFVTGVLFWIFLYHSLVKFLQDYFLACHITSIIQSLLTCSIGITTLSTISKNSLDLIAPNSTTSSILNNYCAFQTSYFFLDIYFMFSKSKTSKNINNNTIKPKSNIDKSLILHHIFMGILIPPITLSLRSNKGDFFVACFMLFEASAPFTNLRAILSHLKIKKSSPIYIANGFLMLITFFLSRIYSPYALVL